MTDGVTLTSFSVGLVQKISVATACVCQIALNQKLSCKFEKWYKFSRYVKAKLHKNKFHKTRLACI
jgi:hypothetical protein